MHEDFLHYIWRYLKFSTTDLKTTCGQPIEILYNGLYLEQEGPDFFNAKIKIGGQIWAGNVELHLRSSDWYAHQHQKDTNYNNVILHVVWEHDCEVHTQHQQFIPTLELHTITDIQLLQRYKHSFAEKKKVPCSNNLSDLSKEHLRLIQQQWLVERLSFIAEDLVPTLEQTKNHWEEVFLKRLFAYFGTKINKEVFADAITRTPYACLMQEGNNECQLTALLFGQLGMLDDVNESDAYFLELKQTYAYLKYKYQLDATPFRVQYFRLRPDNFPTIRVAQFANLLSKRKSFFFEMNGFEKLAQFYEYFESQAPAYWNNHYRFGETSERVYPKKMSQSFIDLLLINVVFPMLYAYHRENSPEYLDRIVEFYEQLPAEKNALIEQFSSEAFDKKHAGNTQALLHQYKHKCSQKKCLLCPVGIQIMR